MCGGIALCVIFKIEAVRIRDEGLYFVQRLIEFA